MTIEYWNDGLKKWMNHPNKELITYKIKHDLTRLDVGNLLETGYEYYSWDFLMIRISSNDLREIQDSPESGKK